MRLENGFKPRWIILHHSATQDGTVNDWEAIRRYHRSYRHKGKIISHEEANALIAKGERIQQPWSDIGYHVGVELEGSKLVVRNGRPIGSEGAHCLGFNDRSIGICLVGSYDTEPPSEDALFILASLCRNLQREFGIPRDQVIGHRESFVKLGKPVEKTCPGLMFDLESFRTRLIG